MFTVEIFEKFAQNPEFYGFGYIGGRKYLDDFQREIADQAAVDVANEIGLTEDEFFEWGNSKLGRWYADGATRIREDKDEEWNLDSVSSESLIPQRF